jgi:hypothetical protein
LSAYEREVLIDLISAVRTLTSHVLTLHLQLGAMRTLLIRNGTISSTALEAALSELGALASIDQLTNPDAPGTDEIFDAMLRRLEERDA